MKTTTKTSLSTSIYSMLGALLATELKLGPNREWEGQSEKNQWMIDMMKACREDAMSLEELEAIASDNADEINKFLKDKGFDIKLDPLNPGEFATAAVFSVLLKWAFEGIRTKEKVDKVNYDYVLMKNSNFQIQLYEPTLEFSKKISEAGNTKMNYIVSVKTETPKDQVFFMMAEEGPETIKELYDTVSSLKDRRHRVSTSDDVSFSFPMIDLNQEIDAEQGLDALIGLRTIDNVGQGWEVTKAKQQNILKINHAGVLAKSATAIVMRKLSTSVSVPEVIIFDKPFYCWIEREGMQQPLFAAYITPDHWNDPGNLS